MSAVATVVVSDPSISFSKIAMSHFRRDKNFEFGANDFSETKEKLKVSDFYINTGLDQGAGVHEISTDNFTDSKFRGISEWASLCLYFHVCSAVQSF